MNICVFCGKQCNAVSRYGLLWANETREPATAFSCKGNQKNLLDDDVLQEAVVSGYTMRVRPAARQTQVSNIRPVSDLQHLMRGTTTESFCTIHRVACSDV